MTKFRSRPPCGGGRHGGSRDGKKWTAEDDAALIDMWRSRVPTGEIAAKLGRSAGALKPRASQLNLPLSMCPDAFPDGKMGLCRGCGGRFFSKMWGHWLCNACKRYWPVSVADESSHTILR